MELNDIRNLVTVLSFALFAVLAWWTWRPAQQSANEAAARLPFEEEAADSTCPTKLTATHKQPS
jgi:cbb3-type cytochrome oxidase subunit 3